MGSRLRRRPLVTVVAKYVELEPKGAGFVGLCCACDGPLVVQGERWACHGCGEGGDALAFLELLMRRVRTTRRGRILG